ncbi:MAG TPA: 6-phosphogluconolactonase [Actinomycetota bacterium]|nr:6-phosphogluconolactonase [Actinomycetota bacterium]
MGRAIEIVVLEDEAVACARAAAVIGAACRSAIAERGSSELALSGGAGPLPMFARLADEDVDWGRATIWQVDERVAPDGDPDRNMTGARAHLPEAAAARIRPMPVTDDDLDAAASRYADELPGAFDVIHLGLGADGHTASLVPGDPVLDVTDRDVAVTGEYGGRRRMTLTYPALGRARFVVWLVTGSGKGEALERLMGRDATIPGSRVRAGRQLVVADREAARLVIPHSG